MNDYTLHVNVMTWDDDTLNTILTNGVLIIAPGYDDSEDEA